MRHAELRLSIITPVLNGAHYIDQCLNNVLAQECPGLEHIIVDGGSNDGTQDRIEAFAREHDYVRLIVQPDERQSDAINRGTQAARGALISILNVDDYFEPGILPRALAVCANLPSPGLLVGNCAVRDAGHRIKYLHRPRQLSLRAFLCGHIHPINPSSYFYHKALHDRLDGYRSDLDYTMDVDFLYRAVEAAACVRHVDEHWGNFVEHAAGKTLRDKAGRKESPRLGALQREFLASQPLAERLLIAVLRPWVVFQRRLINRLSRPRA